MALPDPAGAAALAHPPTSAPQRPIYMPTLCPAQTS